MVSKKLNDLYENLVKYNKFEEDDSYPELFLETVDQIVMEQNPSSIPILLSYFDDNSDYSWVMESMIGQIEHFEKSDFVVEIIKNLNMMSKNALECLFGIIFPILNAPEYLEIFRQNMHLADRECLLKLFDLMEQESPHHHELIQELRKELK